MSQKPKESFWRVESSGQTDRVRKLTKQRQKQQEEFEALASKAVKDNEVSVKKLTDSFKKHDNTIEQIFTDVTTGLVTKDEFAERREQLERLASAKKDEERKAVERKAENTRQKRQKDKKTLLSFCGDEDEEEEEEDDQPPAKKQKQLGKDPTINTSFLPDKQREMDEEDMRRDLRKEWAEQQKQIKEEPLKIVYSYWDGKGNRRTTTVQKGWTVARFLAEKVQMEFKELKRQSVDSLMYIKEDLIIPLNYTFYDLIVTKARGKSGPLFKFDAVDDVRLQNDATTERNETHAGKVVEKKWYERNKHIFPASNWEPFDPTKDYGTYGIGGRRVKNC